MRAVWFAGVIALISSAAFAQTPGLATPTGHEANVSVGSYNYTEPDGLSISIHGAKLGGEYTGTMSLSKTRHWFLQANVRGNTGSTTYDGWCSPFLINPNDASPNGYELGFGAASACSATGNQDWYLETRGLVGKDFIGAKMAWSPYSGMGFRHLANGLVGVNGYRTDEYLYLPLGITARIKAAAHGALSFNLESDILLHGWQKTRDSQLGGGDIPATDTAPGFTVDGFTDVSFAQHTGFALRVSAKYQMNRRWYLEPYYIGWHVSASPVNNETATFTVNGITAQEQVGFYEPRNVTNEFGVKFGFRF
jgi:hypothetical protein